MSIFLSQFYFGFKNKTTFGEINILDCNFLSSSYGNESHKSVGYVIVIPWVYTTNISVDLAHHEIFYAKDGKGGINTFSSENSR